jgi:hypothetical protein
MKFLRKIKIFLSLNIHTKILLIEALIFLGWGGILKKMPFSRIALSLGVQALETSFSLKEISAKDLKKISSAINIMSRYTFWESKCLVRAIAGMKMLNRRRVDSTIYLGTAKDEKGKLIAHAWLRSGPLYITGAEGMEKFIVVGKFGKKHYKIKGEENGSSY